MLSYYFKGAVLPYYTGSRNEARGLVAPGHNPRFDIDEEVLPIGVAVMGQVVAEYL